MHYKVVIWGVLEMPTLKATYLDINVNMANKADIADIKTLRYYVTSKIHQLNYTEKNK